MPRLLSCLGLLALWLATPAHVLSQTCPASEGVATLAYGLRANATGGPVVSAHRGGPAPGYPENALETFERTVARTPVPLILETDVRLTADSVLVLLHDETLDRTTTGTGRVDAHPLAYLRTLRLRDPEGAVTPFRLPTLAEALAWSDGRATLTVEPKIGVPPARFVAALRSAKAEARVIVILHDTPEYATYLRLAPDLVYSVNVPTVAALEEVLAVEGARPCLMVAFVGIRPPTRELLRRLAAVNIRAIQGVFGAEEAQAEHEGAATMWEVRASGVQVIATGAVDAAAKSGVPLRADAARPCPAPASGKAKCIEAPAPGRSQPRHGPEATLSPGQRLHIGL